MTSNKEREVAIAVDHTLRRESLRASRLADELKKESLLQDSPGHQPPQSCPVLTQCELFKDHLMDKHSLFSIGPCLAACYCNHCSAGKTAVAPSGTHPHPYTLPIGWCQFTLRLESFVPIYLPFLSRLVLSLPSDAGHIRTSWRRTSVLTGTQPTVACLVPRWQE